ncbi:uncharacterized protein LOC111714075 [Eurytemora carolleeae]|uniref:uncharacterized protein LOC111714075 n=1 Tax=Eurytemora carolleeae TaxID=1294199 RepID=UPI000C785B30|nr:uncharacterized protein LOC111714075 [Eurytemora carolleeae]|eukprot:XP_023344875.1 uncharacterized protein LOC111714075 [Eurytemora affinis]
MFDRLGEIILTNERYGSDAELPKVMTWFPKQEDFTPPPPMSETTFEKMERISAAIKVGRNEISDILYGGDTLAEEKVIRSLELKRDAAGLLKLFQDCEEDPITKSGEGQELLAKCRAGLIDYQANINTLDPLKFANDMKIENEFKSGLEKLLIPWINDAEKTTNNPLEKPTSFEHARELEMKCVKFAKEVRKANKLLGRIEEAAKRLSSNQTTAEMAVEAEKTRFRKIASIAATRVESMRDLLIRWEEMTVSTEKDKLDFQPLTMFLKCYAVYFS